MTRLWSIPKLLEQLSLVALACISAILLCLYLPSTAFALDFDGVIHTVSDDSYAPSGYDWHPEFTGVTSERGFVSSSDISQYYASNCVPGIAKEGDSGFAAFISSTTNVKKSDGGYRFALRYTGASYTDENGVSHDIDAIVTITGWTYKEYSGGFDKDPYLTKYPPKNAKSGIFVDNNYSPNAQERKSSSLASLTNFNFFTVGFTDIDLSIQFVEAGTTTPIRVTGHCTCIDLDRYQGFSFSGGVVRAEVSSSSQETRDSSTKEKWLEISSDKKSVTGTGSIAADDSDNNYQKGLVAIYFDTGENGNDSIDIHFDTSLGRDGAWTSVSFFALSSEYLANPPEFNMTLTKEESTDSAKLKDTVTYTLSTTLPKEGVQVRIGYKLSGLTFEDNVVDQLELTGNFKVALDGKELDTSAYSTTVTKKGILIKMSDSFLESLSLNGQTLALSFDATVTSYPEKDVDGRLIIPNEGSLTVGTDDPTISNKVELEIAPPLQYGSVKVSKKIKADQVYWQHGTPSFLVSVKGEDTEGTSHEYACLLTIDKNAQVTEDGYYLAEYEFTKIPYGSYFVEESSSLRYSLDKISTNGTTDQSEASITVDGSVVPYVCFVNKTRNYDGGSDSTAVVNQLSS